MVPSLHVDLRCFQTNCSFFAVSAQEDNGSYAVTFAIKTQSLRGFAGPLVCFHGSGCTYSLHVSQVSFQTAPLVPGGRSPLLQGDLIRWTNFTLQRSVIHLLHYLYAVNATSLHWTGGCTGGTSQYSAGFSSCVETQILLVEEFLGLFHWKNEKRMIPVEVGGAKAPVSPVRFTNPVSLPLPLSTCLNDPPSGV